VRKEARVIDSSNTVNAGRISMRTGAALLRLTRPQQWVKNAVVLAGLVFAEAASQPRAVAEALIALVAFVLASGAVYAFNDFRDVEADRLHPEKRSRPIAARDVSERAAIWFGIVLAVAATGIGALVHPLLGGIVIAYVVMMVAYTVWFKRIPILDVTVIAIGFVMRAVGGAVAVDVPISAWLLLCAFLLALFLGFGKRRAESISLGDGATRHRAALQGYTAPLLDQLVGITAVSALVTYAVYTVVSTSAPPNDSMLFTVPFVAFAIFRYLFLVYGRGLGGSPEGLLLRDRWLLGSVVLWAVVALVLVKTGGRPIDMLI
jgi:4-hydroxybenzoate polyprenyltransferase